MPDLQLDPAEVRDEIQSADKQVKVAADHLKMRGGGGGDTSSWSEVCFRSGLAWFFHQEGLKKEHYSLLLEKIQTSYVFIWPPSGS